MRPSLMRVGLKWRPTVTLPMVHGPALLHFWVIATPMIMTHMLGSHEAYVLDASGSWGNDLCGVQFTGCSNSHFTL